MKRSFPEAGLPIPQKAGGAAVKTSDHTAQRVGAARQDTRRPTPGPNSRASAMLTVRDGVLLALYGTVFLTVRMLPVGALTLLVARRSRVERRAAYLPLSFAGASVVILTGLGIPGLVFDQLAGV